MDLIDSPTHLPLLAQWHHEEWSYLNPSQTLEERIKKMELYLSNEIIPSTFLAKEGNTVLGSSALVLHDMDTNTHLSPWLASVYVHPDNRCKGVGSKLVTHAMNVAKDKGIPKLYLFTPDKADFYARLGWLTLHTEVYRDCHVTVMEAILKDE